MSDKAADTRAERRERLFRLSWLCNDIFRLFTQCDFLRRKAANKWSVTEDDIAVLDDVAGNLEKDLYLLYEKHFRAVKDIGDWANYRGWV